MKNIDLNLSQMAHGAIQEKLDGELEKIFENIHDPNTPYKTKRTLTIKLDFAPDEKREVILFDSNFTTKLAPVIGVTATVLTGKNIHSGKIEAKELKSGRQGQGYIDVGTGQVKTDTGEPVDVIEKEMEKKGQIIDLQKNRA